LNFKTIRPIIIVLLILVTLMTAGTVFAQTDNSWCVSPDVVTPVGCARVTLSPAASLKGDFYLGETLLATQVNPAQLLLPPGSQRITVKNITSTEAGYGVLFVYNDTAGNVFTTADQVSNTTLYPTKKNIRGTLNLTCDIRGTTATDVIGCAVSINGVPQPDILAPAAKRDYILDPGSHAVVVTATGASNVYWTPASQQQTVTINAGRTSYYSPVFNKLAHLLIQNNQPGVLADYYIDGVLIASQVPATDMWVTPYKTHRVDAKNFTDAAANGNYTYRDATTYAYLNPGQERTVTVSLTKQYLKGFFRLSCNITGMLPGESLYCQPSIDGVAAAPIAPGTTTEYALTSGKHDVLVMLGPSGSAAPVSFVLYVYAGGIINRTATFAAHPPASSTPIPPPATATPIVPATPQGTVIVNSEVPGSTCRIVVNGNGLPETVFLDAPASRVLPAGTYQWQAFLGYGQTSGSTFTLRPGGTCQFLCRADAVYWGCN
jgi:hypothetical protein